MSRRRCVMCWDWTPYALYPRDRGMVGPTLGLCGRCFNDNDRLAHAVAFSRAVWRREGKR